MKLPCGCQKSWLMGRFLSMCLAFEWYELFDLIHGKTPTLKGGQ